jgi:hypothetical protein
MLDGKGKNDGGAQLAAMGLAGYGTRQLPKGEMGVACVSSQERELDGVYRADQLQHLHALAHEPGA